MKLNQFEKLFTSKLHLIRKLGYVKNYKNYFDINCSKLRSEGDDKNNINVMIDLITDDDIKSIYTYLNSPVQIKKIIIKKYAK